MAKFTCPNCKEQSVSLMDKFRLGWWMTTHCEQCEARIAAFPWVLMLISFAHVWNIIWWGGMVMFADSLHYIIYMFAGWLVLELINLYFAPLATLQKKVAQE